MSFIASLFNLISSSKAKRSYYSLIGRHTKKFCSRAAGRSANVRQKKIMFVAAAGADELVARLLGFQIKEGDVFRGSNGPDKQFAGQAVGRALRVYLSALLVMLGGEKDKLLREIGLAEDGWMAVWCQVFDYGQEDMEIFNEMCLLPGQEKGFDGLIKSAGKMIFGTLFPEMDKGDQDLAPLRESLSYDLSRILQIIASE
jgi:hypothetical protein